MKLIRSFSITLALLLSAIPLAKADAIRIASYNIKFFATGVVNQGDRLDKLKQVIDVLDADIIGLQEIDDRAALMLLFPTNKWEIIIDDTSGDDQDVALVALKSAVTVKGHEYLFPGSSNNTFFPNRRDVLSVELQLPNSAGSFFVMVQHAKARFGGRKQTDDRREGAARKLVEKIKQDFDDRDFILLGDLNDNPDDRSLNILETGDPNALGGPEEMDGPLLVNLMDQLCADGHVSHGRSSSDIVAGQINTLDPNSRSRNNNARGTDANTGDILFDQILFPVSMKNKYVGGSVKVFNHPSGVSGNDDTRASDHLPVYAEFDFEAAVAPPATTTLRIAGLLPNPEGTDAGHEQVVLANGTASAVNLQGFKLRDKSHNEFSLSGVVPSGSKLTITMQGNSMPLNNDTDEIQLIDPQGDEKDKVSYTASQVKVGQMIEFP